MDSNPGLPWPPAGSITIEHEEGGRRVLCLRGDVDTAVATRFRGLQGRERVVVDEIDAGDVSFISSSGLAVVLLCAEASMADGRRPVLRASSHPVNRALQLSGMDGYLPRPEPRNQRPAGTSAARAADAPGSDHRSGRHGVKR